jgi:hypothetical protein
MKIRFGTNWTHILRTQLLAVTFMVSASVSLFIRDVLDEAHTELLDSRVPNTTASRSAYSCGIPYEECRCSDQAKQNVHLEHCLTDDFLLRSRIFIIVSFVLQCVLAEDLFSVEGKYARCVISALWTTALFTSIAVPVGIHWSSCFHRLISAIFCCTGLLLFCLVVYEVVREDEMHRASHSSPGTVHIQPSERRNRDPSERRNRDRPIVWQELL